MSIATVCRRVVSCVPHVAFFNFEIYDAWKSLARKTVDMSIGSFFRVVSP